MSFRWETLVFAPRELVFAGAGAALAGNCLIMSTVSSGKNLT